jgi:hypothetical protein
MLTGFQKAGPIFNIGVDVITPGSNLDTKYMVTVLTREKWTRRPGTLPAVEVLV